MAREGIKLDTYKARPAHPAVASAMAREGGAKGVLSAGLSGEAARPSPPFQMLTRTSINLDTFKAK
jgi:hypothetical protein